MTRVSVILAALLLSACGKPSATQQGLPPDFALASKAITLPEDRLALPERAAIVTQNCTGCHSAEMLTTQPVLDAKTWAAEIEKMRKVYHAPIDPKDDARLIAALTALSTQQARAGR